MFHFPSRLQLFEAESYLMLTDIESIANDFIAFTNPNPCDASVHACGSGSTCVCFTSKDSGGVCSVNGSGCSGSCMTNSDCGSGSACSGAFGCCISASDISSCGDGGINKRMFKRQGPSILGKQHLFKQLDGTEYVD